VCERRKPVQKIRIQAPEELQGFLPKYVDNRKRDLKNLQDALEKGDVNFIEMTSHKIRGHAASYGFVRLSEICKLMELASRNSDLAQVRTLIGEYEVYIGNVEI